MTFRVRERDKGGGVKFGVFTVVNAGGIGQVELGRAVEQRGFESLYFPEHTHVPVVVAQRPPGEPDFPEVLRRLLDPFVALGAVAAVTTRLTLVTAVSLLVQRDPIIFAKEAATVDLISDGRLIVGVGAGYVLAEIRNHGVDPAERGAVLDERLQAVKLLWERDEAEFHGEHVDFGPVHSWPKPVQRPGPPIYVGGNSRAAFQRIARHAHGWLAPPLPVPEMARAMGELDRLAGRRVPVSVTYTPADRELIEGYERLGVERVALSVPTLSRDDVLTHLDELVAFVDRYSG